MRTAARQSGITILGFIFVAAVVLTVAMVGFRVLPSYIEYFSVLKTLKQTLDTTRDGETLAEFRRDFDLKAERRLHRFGQRRGRRLQQAGQQASSPAPAWTKTLPLVGNVSLLLDFSASASK